jgi:hypothetical protein
MERVLLLLASVERGRKTGMRQDGRPSSSSDSRREKGMILLSTRNSAHPPIEHAQNLRHLEQYRSLHHSYVLLTEYHRHRMTLTLVSSVEDIRLKLACLASALLDMYWV